jgi:hypothetical protein
LDQKGDRCWRERQRKQGSFPWCASTLESVYQAKNAEDEGNVNEKEKVGGETNLGCSTVSEEKGEEQDVTKLRKQSNDDERRLGRNISDLVYLLVSRRRKWQWQRRRKRMFMKAGGQW